MIELSDNNFESAIKSCSKTAIVDFYATWCGPCKQLAITLDEIQNEGNIEIFKVDVEKAPETVQRFEIMNVPTMIFFVNGVEIHKIIGNTDKSNILRVLRA